MWPECEEEFKTCVPHIEVMFKVHLNQAQGFSVAIKSADHQSTLKCGDYENGHSLWIHVTFDLAVLDSCPCHTGEPLAPSAKSFLYPFSSNAALPSSE